VISLRGVHYTYPGAEIPALAGIDLDIAEGSFCAVIGANGAGKSTLCYTIGGFVPHYFHGDLAGEVVVDGRNTREHPLGELVRHCGLLFPNPSNQITGARFTVREELAFGLENLGLPADEMHERIDGVLTMLGITALVDRSPLALSGGQQQRVALASILVMGPRVLLLDEPTAQLDPLGSREVFSAIRALSQLGMTVVLVEHKPELIAAFADRVVVVREGKVAMDGSPGQILAAPELHEFGIASARWTDAAREGVGHGLWPEGRPLPVTLDDADAGFRAIARQLQ
jgi:energy-coupling factor transport system ATP-binding protein